MSPAKKRGAGLKLVNENLLKKADWAPHYYLQHEIMLQKQYTETNKVSTNKILIETN